MFAVARRCHLIVDKFHALVMGVPQTEAINQACNRLHRRILKGNYKSVHVTVIPKDDINAPE